MIHLSQNALRSRQQTFRLHLQESVAAVMTRAKTPVIARTC